MHFISTTTNTSFYLLFRNHRYLHSNTKLAYEKNAAHYQCVEAAYAQYLAAYKLLGIVLISGFHTFHSRLV